MSGTGFICGSRQRFGFKTKKAVCSVCGKEFMRSDQHGYHAGGKWQCSYTCFRIPEEEERKAYREKLDRKLAVISYSERTKGDAIKRRRQMPAHLMEKALRRVEYCEAMVGMFTERANRLPTGVKQRKYAKSRASYWREKLETSREEVARLEKEMEASKNVRASEAEAAGGHGQDAAAQNAV